MIGSPQPAASDDSEKSLTKFSCNFTIKNDDDDDVNVKVAEKEYNKKED